MDEHALSETTAGASRELAASLIGGVTDWLVDQALAHTTLEETFCGCCERLLAAGVPLSRAQIAFRTLHPLWDTVEMTWYRGRELAISEYAETDTLEAFQRSPFAHLLRHGLPTLRRRLGDDAGREFPVLDELMREGATDYFAYMIPFGAPDHYDGGVGGSWATDRPPGFSDEAIEALSRVQRRLAVACKVSVKQQIAHNIATAYLGESAGRQVLDGRIRRGDGERIHAVIWFCDLRGSTRLAESVPLPRFLATVNDFFECMASAVLANEGEVLRFIGDAVLAIFPMERHDTADPRTCPVHRRACRSALKAMRSALDGMAALNERRERAGQEPIRFGIALHVGDVMYGNIGAPRRLEFSVIGAAVNQAARLESLCKTLGKSALVSAEVAAILPDEATPVGTFELDGVAGAQAVFEPTAPDGGAAGDA